MMEEACSSETLVSADISTRCYNPDDHSLKSHHRRDVLFGCLFNDDVSIQTT
jgi:hypothetical protein